MRTVVSCVAAISLVACRGGGGATAPIPAPPDAPTSTVLVVNATVQRVVDGDTVVAAVDGTIERVRLIGVNTPESVKPDTPVECFGHEASQHTAELLPPGTVIHLERDLEPRDDYGRLLAYVFRATDGLFVNDDLVRLGYARTLRIRPNVTYAAQLARSSQRARDEGLGLWSTCR